MVDDFANAAGAGRGGPLSGIRVLDLSRVLAGPWCTQALADLGAEVLKIESPGEGDETRGWGPPSMGGLSAYFTCANCSKHSLVVDLKNPSGQESSARWQRPPILSWKISSSARSNGSGLATSS
jgi:crotonobetainyl-CoA:carnitine CoA-transferase CaiB-like acyl-CoA transferase